jgi:diguanylate cyclase (GGDEF)-like protein
MRVFSVVFIVLLVSAFRRVFDREKADARIDPLTKLSNRRAFEVECRRIALSCERDGRVLLCGLIDVDSFKSINDEYGHSAGDAVLIALANALSSAVRPYDATARLGGDEFAFCLAVRNDEVAKRKAQDIHRRIASALEVGRWPATCSVGASTGANIGEALAKADKVLYQVKEAGRRSWSFASIPGICT